MGSRASHANRRDKNESAIVEAFRRCACTVIPMQPGQGFDLLVIAPNGIHLVEVKNSDYSWELTQPESLLKIQAEQVGQVYSVIETVEDALRLIGVLD